MSKQDSLEDEYQAFIEWAQARELEPHELMSLCSVTIGRTIAALAENGMAYADVMALAHKAQQGMIEGAGITSGDDAPGDRTKH